MGVLRTRDGRLNPTARELSAVCPPPRAGEKSDDGRVQPTVYPPSLEFEFRPRVFARKNLQGAFMRRSYPFNCRIVAIAGLALSIVLSGCATPPNSAGAPGATNGNAPSGVPAKKAFRAALVLDTGGVDDKSFNAAAYAGLKKAETELGLGKDGIAMVESKTASDYKSNLTNFATQGYDVVFAVGFKMQDALKEVAPQFPNVKFAIVDGSDPKEPNCSALQFKEEQGTFLAGFLAASVSKTKKIGFVGGEEIDLIKKFEAGYRAGAKTAGFDPDKQVLRSYTGDWNDTAKGRSNADLEFGNGADTIFAAAGRAGLGVITAAEAKGAGFYAIGVDQDQDDVAKGRVLTSMVKHVDTAVFDTISKVKDGQFAPGANVYELRQGGVGLSDMKYTKQDVPAEVLLQIEKLKQMIVDGKVVPPTKLEDVKTFSPPKL